MEMDESVGTTCSKPEQHPVLLMVGQVEKTSFLLTSSARELVLDVVEVVERHGLGILLLLLIRLFFFGLVGVAPLVCNEEDGAAALASDTRRLLPRLQRLPTPPSIPHP